MKATPDGEYQYVVHARDHFSRYSWASPMKSKEAINVSAFLFHIFSQFGPPTILQTDNGGEFTANVIHELMAMWPETSIINGRPRHPQSQGSVEKGNAILKTKLSAWMESNNRNDWSLGLPLVICKYSILSLLNMDHHILY